MTLHFFYLLKQRGFQNKLIRFFKYLTLLNLFIVNSLFAQPSQKLFYTDWTVEPGKVYYVGTSGEQQVFTASSGRIYYTTVGSDGALYFSDANKNKLLRWTGDVISTIYTHTTYLRDIAFDPQGDLYFSESSGAMADGKIYILNDGAPTLFYTVTLASVGGFWAGNFAFASDGTLYLSTGNRRGANIYRVTSDVPTSIYNDPAGSIDGFDIDQAGNIFYADWFQNIYKVTPGGERTIETNNVGRRFSDVSIVKTSVGIGPEKGRVNNVALHPSNPNILYAGTSSGGVFRSYNGGQTWDWIGNGLSNARINGLLVNPSDPNIIMATTPAGIFRSPNQGRTWSLVQSVTQPLPPVTLLPFTGELQAGPIRLNSLDGFIYAAPYVNGLYKSTTGGTSWSQIYGAGLAPNDKCVTSFDFSSESGGSIFIVTPNGIKQSIAGGDFNPIGMEIIGNPIALQVAPSMTNRIYAVTSNLSHWPPQSNMWRRDIVGGVFSATSVTPPFANFLMRSLAIAPANADLVYAGWVGLNKSTNAGTDWTNGTLGCPSSTICYADYRGLTFDASGNKLYAAHDQGLFRYDVTTNTYTSIEDGLVNIQFYCMDVGTNGTIYGGAQDMFPFWKLGPSNWTVMRVYCDPVCSGDILDMVVDPTDDQHVFYRNNAEYVMRSSDRGNSAFRSNTFGAQEFWNHQLVYNHATTTLFAGTRYIGVFKSTDDGVTFNPANTNIEHLQIRCLTNQPGSDQILYTGSLLNGVYKTTTGGTSWQQLTNFPEAGALVITVKAGGDRVYAGTVNGVYLSTNGGDTWIPRSNGLPSTKVVSELMIDPLCPCAIYAGLGYYDGDNLYGGGVYQSTDGGATWTRLSSDREIMVPVTSIKIDPLDRTRLFIATFGSSIRMLFRDIPGSCVCPL